MSKNNRNRLLPRLPDRPADAVKDRVLSTDEWTATFDVPAETFRRRRDRGRPTRRCGRDHVQGRVRRILALPLDYIPSPEFEKPNAPQVILGPLPESAGPRRPARPPPGVPPYIASLYEVPLLSPAQELYLFRKYNYLKYRARELRRRLNVQRPAQTVLEEIERLYDEAVATKNRIIRANLRLVVSVAKRHITDEHQLADLISDGNESLMRAVEKFDYTRGFKFSTYAVWALKRNSVRNYAMEMKYRDRFRSGQEELFAERPEHRGDPRQQLRAQQQREADVVKILCRLPERERWIIRRRFGLAPGEEPKTLQEIANEMGISKERTRQLERRALETLRAVSAEQNLEFTETADVEF